jgi:hypothetical protein
VGAVLSTYQKNRVENVYVFVKFCLLGLYKIKTIQLHSFEVGAFSIPLAEKRN